MTPTKIEPEKKNDQYLRDKSKRTPLNMFSVPT